MRANRTDYLLASQELLGIVASGVKTVRRFWVGGETGQSLVEFSLSALLLAVLLFAIIQYGFLFAAYVTVRNASALGARQYAILMTSGQQAYASNVVTFTKSAISPMLNSSVATVTTGSTVVAGAPAWSVTVNYQLPLIIPFVVPGATNGMRTLTATTVAR